METLFIWMAVHHKLSVIPPEILTKIASSLSIQDLARSYGIDTSWANLVLDKLRVYINDKLRVVVFDDGEQTHCVWLPFAGIQKGAICYRDDKCMDCPMCDELVMTPRWHRLRNGGWPLQRSSYGRQGWMHCNVDLAQTTLFLDLEDSTFGRVKLGLPDHRQGVLPMGRHIHEEMAQKTQASGGTREQVLENGTLVRYSVHYDMIIEPDVSSSDDDDSDFFTGMSLLCVHEICLPIACLRSGVSSICI